MLEHRCISYTDRSTDKTTINTIIYNSELPSFFCCFFDSVLIVDVLGSSYDNLSSKLFSLFSESKF